MPSQMTENERK